MSAPSLSLHCCVNPKWHIERQCATPTSYSKPGIEHPEENHWNILQIDCSAIEIIAYISEVLKEMDLYDEIIEFETLVRKIKYVKSKYSGVKETFKSKNQEEYENMPQDLKFTINEDINSCCK